MMKRGWFNDNWRHGLSARGISSTNRYFRRKPVAKKFISIAEGLPKSPVNVYKDVMPYQRGTTGELKRNIRRTQVLKSSQGKELLRLEKERDALQSMITRMGSKSNPEVTKDLREQLKTSEDNISSLMSLPAHSREQIRIAELAAKSSEKRSRIQALARPGEATEAQKAAIGLTDVQKSALEAVSKRSGMRASEEKVIPKAIRGAHSESRKKTPLDFLRSKQTIQDVAEKRQKSLEAMKEGRELSEEQQKPKKYERTEFPDEGDE